MTMRRNTRDERILFHYNGHGVPKPTDNGEIWVFNKDFTQYIPLSLYDLQQWLGSSTICVFECSSAGTAVKWFEKFLEQRQQERERIGRQEKGANLGQVQEDHILLAACGVNETLPINAALPADMFTSCLTTPIKMALRWALMNTILLDISPALIDQIPGKLNDRRTPLGELNWIFTAVTDTIAWTVLPKHLFQKLFRQDLLVACLFRNFLLAERIMPPCRCTPISVPKLPPTYNHSMWLAWDLAVDSCLSKLSKHNAGYQNGVNNDFKHYSFFSDQLTAFEVWMKFGSQDRGSPEQLPIVLQVLLSQQHRLRALKLLGQFLDLGSWAVNQGLCVGIFPYVLKLLKSPAPELVETLVFIWAKILAVDKTCQVDLAKEDGHIYFLKVLENPKSPPAQRVQSEFILSVICNQNRLGQSLCLNSNLMQLCLNQLSHEDPEVRKWAVFCLSKFWESYDDAQEMVTKESACEKLSLLLTDPIPEVRAAIVYAFGTFLKREKEGSNIKTLPNNFGILLLRLALNMSVAIVDASPLVRAELTIALARFVDICAEPFLELLNQFKVISLQRLELKERDLCGSSGSTTPLPTGTWENMRSAHEYNLGKRVDEGETNAHQLTPSKKRVGSSVSKDGELDQRQVVDPGLPLPQEPRQFEGMANRESYTKKVDAELTGLLDYRSGIYEFIWKVIRSLAIDPCSEVSKVAQHLVDSIQQAAKQYKNLGNHLHQEYLEKSTAYNGSTEDKRASWTASSVKSYDETGDRQRADSTRRNSSGGESSRGDTKPPDQSPDQETILPTVLQNRHQSGAPSVDQSDPTSSNATTNISNVPVFNTTASAHKSTSNQPKNSANVPCSASQKNTNPNSKISTLTSFLSKTLSTHLITTPQTSPPTHTSLPCTSSRLAAANQPNSAPSPANVNLFEPETGPSEDPGNSDNFSSIQAQLHASLSEDPLIYSTLYDEACTYFSYPLMRSQEDDEMSPDVSERWWKRQCNEYLMNEVEEWISSQAAVLNTKKLETEVTILENESAIRTLAFNSFEPIICVADDTANVVLWNWVQGNKMAVINNHKNQAKITSLNFLNEQEVPLIAVGSDDGVVRIWDNIYSNSRLVTAWRVLMNASPVSTSSPISLVLEWQQQNERLLASGNTNLIRVWDLDHELSIQDVPTNSEFPLTCMTSDKNTSKGTTVMTGFEDGSIRFFDLRQPTYSAPIAVYSEHQSRIINISAPKSTNGIVISGSSNGIIKFWDQSGASETSQRTISSFSSSSTMVAFSVYEQASIMAVGVHDQRVKIMNFIGNELSVIKYHDGFLRQRIGPITSMTFHPYSALLAVGASDSLVSIYAGEHIKVNPAQ
ncbi:protein raptor homolog isoform X2 [Schistocerca gregaria]|nr:protein raptor homolog isoform X2 [Schistocerca gregaria]